MAMLEVEAGLVVGLCDTVQGLTEEVRRMRVASTARPNSYKTSGSAVCDANGFALIILDKCPMGQRWVLRKMVVGGVTWGTSAGGHCQIIVGGVAISPGTAPDVSLSLLNTEDGDSSGLSAGTGMPVAFKYPTGDMIVLDGNDTLAVYITGGTNGQQYLAHARLDRHFLEGPPPPYVTTR